jgi:ADP-heptose:LPS heptosyltransferase
MGRKDHRLKKLERAGRVAIDRVLGLGRGSRPSLGSVIPESVRDILVVRPHNQMGDMLLSTPLFSALRRAFPGARITLIASPDNYEMMIAHPDIDELRVFDKKRLRRRPGDLWRFWRFLRRTSWDTVIMPTTVSFSLTSSVIAWLARGRVRVGSDGSAYGRSMGATIFDIQVPCEWDREHQTQRNLDFARAVGAQPVTLAPSMGLRDEETAWARGQLQDLKREASRIIGIHPGAGKIPNRWPIERFGQVASDLASDPGSHVCIMVGPREGDLLRIVRDQLGERATYFAGMSVRQAAALIGEFDFFLCNDTGVMHIGAALSTPTLALFGPTDPQMWAPQVPNLRWIRGADDRMDSIGVDEVLTGIQDMLSSHHRDGDLDHARGGSRS